MIIGAAFATRMEGVGGGHRSGGMVAFCDLHLLDRRRAGDCRSACCARLARSRAAARVCCTIEGRHDISHRITYVGHATLLIEAGGVRILTDPGAARIGSHTCAGARHRCWSMWQEHLDAVLISHLHYDHLDLPSLRKLGQATRLIVPVGAGALLRQHGFTHVEELRVGERTSVNGVPVTGDAAVHSGARGPLGPTAECLGYIVGASAHAGVYFAGDTDLFPEMAQMAGSVDVALMPVWGWGPTLGAGHMDPYRAAQASQIIAPQIAIPIHWGTLYPLAIHPSRKAFLVDPPFLFREFHAAPGATGGRAHPAAGRALPKWSEPSAIRSQDSVTRSRLPRLSASIVFTNVFMLTPSCLARSDKTRMQAFGCALNKLAAVRAATARFRHRQPYTLERRNRLL
jgi:L-ascorbate metabolism protein UlaG (beta-lactamase superfamily)